MTTVIPPSELDRRRAVRQVVNDLTSLAEHAPAIGAMSPRVKNIAAGFRWRWSLFGIGPDDIQAARRAIAWDIHPDRAPMDRRASASGHTALAFAVIDAALDDAIDDINDLPLSAPASPAREKETRR